jgi:hypothetical protein
LNSEYGGPLETSDTSGGCRFFDIDINARREYLTRVKKIAHLADEIAVISLTNLQALTLRGPKHEGLAHEKADMPARETTTGYVLLLRSEDRRSNHCSAKSS